jgi:thioredoxin-related protein
MKMKKIIIPGLFLFLLTLGTFGCLTHKKATATPAPVVVKLDSAIRWVSLAEAQKLDSIAPRKIFLDISTSWCGWCKTMDANTFRNPTIATYMNKTYYCVHFDAETRDTVIFNGQKFWNAGPVGQRSANNFAITVLQGRLSYPSFAFISKNRMTFTIMQGYMSPQQFEPYIHYYGEEKESTVQYDEFMKTFKSELPASDLNQPTPVPAPH